MGNELVSKEGSRPFGMNAHATRAILTPSKGPGMVIRLLGMSLRNALEPTTRSHLGKPQSTCTKVSSGKLTLVKFESKREPCNCGNNSLLASQAALPIGFDLISSQHNSIHNILKILKSAPCAVKLNEWRAHGLPIEARTDDHSHRNFSIPPTCSCSSEGGWMSLDCFFNQVWFMRWPVEATDRISIRALKALRHARHSSSLPP